MTATTEMEPQARPELAETIPTHRNPTTGRIVVRRYPLRPAIDRATLLGVSMRDLAGRLGYADNDDAAIWRAVYTGVTVAMADRIALALGTMPHELWPTWHADARADADVLCGTLDGIAEHYANGDPTPCARCATWAASPEGRRTTARRYYDAAGNIRRRPTAA